jgi:mycoredoxin
MVPYARDYLDRVNIRYDYVDIYQDQQARERVRQINRGYESVPTIIFPDGSTLTEPTARELEAKLKEAGIRFSPL